MTFWLRGLKSPPCLQLQLSPHLAWHSSSLKIRWETFSTRPSSIIAFATKVSCSCQHFVSVSSKLEATVAQVQQRLRTNAMLRQCGHCKVLRCRRSGERVSGFYQRLLKQPFLVARSRRGERENRPSPQMCNIICPQP